MVCPQEAYIGDGQVEDTFTVVVEYGQLLAVLQLLLDPPYLIGNLMCSRDLHVGRKASYHQLWAEEQEVRGFCGLTCVHVTPYTPRELEVPGY